MGALSPSFILGVVVLFYLLSFVLFALVRIATGVSIQRIGYFSLRHIAYTPRDGIRIDLRSFGIHLHRPTFAQPTWISLRLRGLKVTIDLQTLAGGKDANDVHESGSFDESDHDIRSESKTRPLLRRMSSGLPRSKTWKRLTHIKEKIKQLHEKIRWIRLLDVELLNSSCILLDVCSAQMGSLTMAVDTRSKTVDRGRLFRHKKIPDGEQRPAEWIFVVKGVLFTPDSKDSLEITDICSLNVHGLLYKDLAGLRDASISLKLGRIHIPYDDLMKCHVRIQQLWSPYDRQLAGATVGHVLVTDMMEESEVFGSREESIVQAVSDSREFISSTLRGIQEIQLAVSFIGLSKEIYSSRPSDIPHYLNFTMNEFGIDLYRLDPKSPAHHMYFCRKDVAHQALLAAISIAVSVDDSGGKPERLLYIPMATTTIKTTLPSKTIVDLEDKNAAERNANMLFANIVVTSPSIDLDQKHLPLVLDFCLDRANRKMEHETVGRRHRLISRLLPKASIKFSVQEPVARMVLPVIGSPLGDSDEYDLLISSISSISLDLESSHSSAGELQYALISNLRISSHQLYYQSANGTRHDLLLTDALELKLQLSAMPEVYVTVSANLQTFSVYMNRPEINIGVHQIVNHFRKVSFAEKTIPHAVHRKPSFLRLVPTWLLHLQIRGSNFGIQLAGIDPGVSKDTRGVSLELESWNMEYKTQKVVDLEAAPQDSGAKKYSATSNHASPERPRSHAPLKAINYADGRRLTMHVQGFKGSVVEGVNFQESEEFISMPRFEVALSTSSDSRGAVFHINSHIKALHLQYSLYRYFAIGVAYTVLQHTFLYTAPITPTDLDLNSGRFSTHQPTDVGSETSALPETVTIDVRATLLQIKATMPSDPPMMLQVNGLEAGRHRWANPFFRSRLIRLYAEAPNIKHAWARVVSIKQLQVDLREGRRKAGKYYVEEKSVDLSMDFIRIAIPHQLILHKVFDNLTNVIKATQQLQHRFKTGMSDYNLRRGPQEPRHVPKVSMRTKVLLFELEDGSFDWKLGLIYRVGLIEQIQRLAREEAFRVKVKKLQEQYQRRDVSRYRAQSSVPDGRARSKRSQRSANGERSKSEEPRSQRRSDFHQDRRGRNMRYNPESGNGLSDVSKISEDQAWYKLQEHNSQSWKQRITFAMRYHSRGIRDIRSIFWGNDEPREIFGESETIVAMPNCPGLMTTIISDLHIMIDKPSFALQDCSRFLHDVGKGIPYDMKYSLLVPMSLQINMGEARVVLRDYPLPLLHVPAIKLGQSPRLPSWSLKTDFVVAEEYRSAESTKYRRIEVIPAHKLAVSPETTNGFCIDICRTVSSVKTYSNVEIAINTGNPTNITWGTSYQPAIQDMMQIIEGFTRPQVDPSDRVGFWDKIRLIFHSRVDVSWKGGGDVHLKLKGSRNPYVVTGHGAGFVMCFRNNVRWTIRQDDDPKKFMSVSSGEYVLAIPDYSHQARKNSRGVDPDTESISSTGSNNNNAIFKKVIMKLSGSVRWLAGLVFERDLDEGGRSFNFLPHYGVAFKTPNHAKAIGGRSYDAFRGFRSQYIHLSIAVVAPVDRDWTVTNLTPSTSYNSAHMSPRFFTHFFDWWSLFSGVMSLPIRQGKLFPGIEKSSKKFGRHLATIKYNLLLSPLFIAHIYKHKDKEDYCAETVGATGLKLRLDSFMLDLHQRREEFSTQGKGRMKQKKTSGMRINQAQLDFISADLRAVSASIAGTSQEDLNKVSDEDLASLADQTAISPDVSRFTIPDHDFLWIDMDDFVELDWILPAETHPQTKIMPLAFAPRFTYLRQTDHKNTSKSFGRSSPFGDEPTHYCIMSQDNDPQRIQCDLIRERMAVIDSQLVVHDRSMGEQELLVVRDGVKDSSLKDQFDILEQQGKILGDKRDFLQSMLDRLSHRVRNHEPWDASVEAPSVSCETNASSRHSEADGDGEPDMTPLADFISDFNNRFTIHNIQLKWNNSLRNIILRYVHQVSQRRGFVYYMSRRAVKFILDIVDEQNRHKEKKYQSQQQTPSEHPSPAIPLRFEDDETDINLEERIQELLRDGRNYVDANDPTPDQSTPKRAGEGLQRDISEEFAALNSYHVRLIAPQIQLQSEKNAKSVILVTANGMQLKIIQIMDKTRIADDVSGLVQRRFTVDMDGVQFFVTNQKALAKYIHLYSGNRYGAPKGSAWPPWVPIEVNFDFKINPFGWSRVVQRTSASLRYDKYNTLRLKYNDEIIKAEAGQSHLLDDAESRIDHLWVEFPHIRAICDSTQYYAMYIIVLDLLLYSEPIEKIRSERLEKIMLAADFSDLTGAPEMVISLQERIRRLEEIKAHFQIHAKELDRQGWQDRLSIERDLTSCEDELFFMMKAITTSQRKNDDRSQSSQSNGLLRWYLSASEIVWHLMRDKNEPMMEIQLKHAAYDRTDNSDGSNNNTMEIQRIHGLNLLPNALYPEMIAPFFENGRSFADQTGQDIKMFKVQWFMLEAIAGIPVLDQFEVNLFPLKVQLEREIGKKLFEYIFPPNADHGGASPFMVKHMAPLHDEDEESEPEASLPTTPRSPMPEAGEGQVSTRPGSLELRLKPTLRLPEESHIGSSVIAKVKVSALPVTNGENYRFRLFSSSNRSKSATRSQPPRSAANRRVSRRRSGENLQSLARTSNDASSTTLASMSTGLERKRFGLHRTNTKDIIADKEKVSDDLTQMMSRASNYMTLAYVKIPSVVLCLSYKGRSERNIEDVHNFVFRMPALEYRNKTWSNLDLALRLKKDVIKALISHTGAIIGNKFSHHRPSKHQQSRLREIANSSSLLARSDQSTTTPTGSSTSLYRRSESAERQGSTHSTFIAGWGNGLHRTQSEASSLDSMISPGNTNGFDLTPKSKASPGNGNLVLPADGPLSQEPDAMPGVTIESADSSIAEPGGNRFLQNAFTRRLTNEGQRLWHNAGGGGGAARDPSGISTPVRTMTEPHYEDRSRKASVIQRGKKFLGTLN